MIIVYLFLLFLVFYQIKFTSNNKEYLSFEQTNAIKGIFILLVFISHCNSYFVEIGYSYSSWSDQLFLALQGVTGQWIVALFLFYSGYGVFTSIVRKGEGYIDQFPKHRILTVLLNFDVAVVAFGALNIIYNEPLTWSRCCLSLICWESLGNSNWYIFVILLCYLSVFLSFKFVGTSISQKLGGACLLVIVSMLIMTQVKEYWWYNTILCFPLGMLFSKYRNYLEPMLRKHFVLFLLLSMVGYCGGILLAKQCPACYNLTALCVVVAVVVLTQKIVIRNKYLVWLGAHLFPLYVYQRIPMIIFSRTDLIGTYPLIYWFVCFVVTLVIAHYYQYWQIKFK